ncbi:MAG: WD40 repeat domain-containing protein [Deltaproteobacteria bacterium]|nr:WD40 repeat domain-containing protein [Deltaproteobacteria bacterium]
MKLVTSLAVLCACSGSPTTRPTNPTGPQTPKVGGLIWQTQAEPWHLPHGNTAVAAFEEVAVFGGQHGWLFQIDLETGKPIRERRLDMGTITSVAHLGNNKWIVAGLSSGEVDSTTVAHVVDGATLASTEIKLNTRMKPASFALPNVVVLSDGGVAITGRGLPLAIYDPATWTVRTTLDPQLGWGRAAGRGEILLVERGGVIKRWNTSTNGQRDLLRGYFTHAASASGVDIVRVARSGVWMAELYPEGGAAVPLKEHIDAFVVDPTGAQLITAARSELRIHALPSGEIKKRIPLDDKKLPLTAMYMFGKRVAVIAGGVLRMIDLDTGVVTPKSGAPSQAMWLAVGNDGAILAANEHAWTMVGGNQVATEQIEDTTSMDKVRPDDPKRYVLTRVAGAVTTVWLRTFGDKTPKTWTLQQAHSDTWLTTDGNLVFELAAEGAHEIVRTKGAGTELLFRFNADSEVFDVDPAADVMLSVDGRVAVASLDGTLRSTLRVPHCEGTLDFGIMERGGTRAALHDTRQLALWDRSAGKLLASVKIDTPEDVVFIPKRSELVLVFHDRVVLWTPTKGTRTLKAPSVLEPAVSADGKKLALSFHDGRIALYDIDGLNAATPLGADLPAGDPIPETCGETDPLAISAPEGGEEGGEEGGVEGGEWE